MDKQLSLFDSGQSSDAFETRTVGNVSGLEYYPRFLSSEEQASILGRVDSMPWQHDLKRRVQHYGYKYDYRARRVDSSMFVGPLPDFAVEVAEKLVTRTMIAALPDQVIVNEYQPGQGITPHVDCEPCFEDTIVTVSLGSVYSMDFFSKNSSRTLSHDLEVGSALVMSGEGRFQWKHGIKARKSDNGRRRGRRVSLTFRTVILNR